MKVLDFLCTQIAENIAESVVLWYNFKFNKETTDKKYHQEMFRAVNFKRDESDSLVCPNGKKFNYLYKQMR